jgi:exopolyphosphatase/guanosine-5'-triphosphate,3'-diphosphate pyrophosphatase
VATTDQQVIARLDPAKPARKAARRVLEHRLGEVDRIVGKLGGSRLKGDKSVRLVHALRVGTRRAESALDAFAPLLDTRAAGSVATRLKRLRKAAGALRDPHVQLDAIRRVAKGAPKSHAAGLTHLAETVARLEAEARRPLRKALDKAARERLGDAELIKKVGAGDSGGPTLCELAVEGLGASVKAITKAGRGPLEDLDHVHALRVSLKKFRYALEIYIPCFAAEARGPMVERLAAVQEALGAVNDAYTLRERMSAEAGRAAADASAPGPSPAAARGLRTLEREQARRLEQAHRHVLGLWEGLSRERFFESLLSSLGPPRPATQVEAKPGPGPAPGPGSGPHRLNGKHPKRTRMGAIDVGTNSVRLIVAEATDDGSYRVLDDEKEITRLGKGLHATGRMDEACIEHTADTIARMRSIAEGYAVSALRVVGTSAAREAKNGPRLVERIREASGLEMEVISGDEEALLAFRSASRAFDLSSQPALVFDIGGGSVELVLSAGSPDAGGRAGPPPVEHMYSLPLGAVRLTERFGGPERIGDDRFDELRRHVKAQLRKAVGKPPLRPQMVVGTGGTLTTLGSMTLHQSVGEPGAEGVGLFGKVQGTIVTRAQVRHLLDYIRKLPLKDRARVPGLSADRVDIIVAGLAVVDAVLKFFGANTLRVHEGGIRDGLLLSMFGPARGGGARGGNDAAGRPDPLRSVRRFAKECNYEASHAKQVTRLALRIFDQLAPAIGAGGGGGGDGGARFDAEARLLLESAALLHDVGYLINYAQHHKHSYHLIVHADLPGLTTRQVQVIANVARYHRAADPKLKHGPFARLSAEDRDLVRQLAAILRVADGLDRTHMQSVRDVTLAATPESVELSLAADAEPAVDIWGAVRKAGLFRKVFGRVVNVEWRRSGGGAAGVGSAGGGSAGVVQRAGASA